MYDRFGDNPQCLTIEKHKKARSGVLLALISWCCHKRNTILYLFTL